jgi:hypothetical protein
MKEAGVGEGWRPGSLLDWWFCGGVLVWGVGIGCWDVLPGRECCDRGEGYILPIESLEVYKIDIL